MSPTAPTTFSTPGLNLAQRSTLERLVIRGRVLLEGDLAAVAEGRYGIHINGAVEDEVALPDATNKLIRGDLADIVARLRTLGEDAPGAVARLLREAAFTHLNRLVAIRIAEAIGLLPESLAKGLQSRGFRDLGEIMPLLAGSYRAYIRLCGDELAVDVPTLFDPRNPLLALEPSTAAFDELVTLFADPATTEIWAASDTLGWAYQFFNTADERREMREASAPRNSRELAVRNQFFTPRYVVDFLVQNTLGRRLVEDNPTSPILSDLPLLVNPPTERGPKVELDDVKCLDPACGSGHFLLGCYDVLERAWGLAGIAPAESAPKIVASLWGVDIDARCAQVASAAIVLRARRNCRGVALPRPNIINAGGLPGGSAALPPDLQLTAEQRTLIDRASEVLSQAPVLGTLLKAEEALNREIRHGTFGGLAGTLPLTDAAAETTERELLFHLQTIANQAASSVAERLLATETDDALRLLEVVRMRYDVVLMNPPYGVPAIGTEPYLQAAYPDTWTEQYGSFVMRGIELLNVTGYLGALTSSQYFTTKRLATFRSTLIRNHRPILLVDLGSGVLQGATVNTAACVLPKSRASGDTYYLDTTQMTPSNRMSAVIQAQSSMQARDVQGFGAIPGSPLALHMPDSLVAMWDSSARLEPSIAKVRTGCKSFDDARFVRAAWEVGPQGLRRGWRRYLKGGEYQPYIAWSHLVIDWRNDGRELCNVAQSEGRLAQVMQSSSHWGAAGLCYPRMSSVGFAARIMPSGEIFADQSIAILPRSEVDPLVLLGLLDSTSVAEILQVFGRGRATENGSMKALPFGPAVLGQLTPIRGNVIALCKEFTEVERGDERSSAFVRPLGLFSKPSITAEETRKRLTRAAIAQSEIDNAVRCALGLARRLDADLPSRVHLLERALPDPDEAPANWARDCLSYAIGVAFGRWDLRVGLEPGLPETGLAYFDAPPECPPGMLLGTDGLPARAAPPAYPLELPPAHLLVDEPGHPWDIEAAVVRSVGALFDDAESVIADVLRILGPNRLREHLRRHFFRDHVARYSRSRRKAPIYWQLTVPSRKWGAWIYAPMLARETLYAVAGEARRRERLGGEAVSRLQREQREGGAGRPVPKVAEELDFEERLAEELRRFRVEAERVAGLGWEPNLDDGIILCAAPLAELFPAWPDAKVALMELRKGEFGWATVAAWADRL